MKYTERSSINTPAPDRLTIYHKGKLIDDILTYPPEINPGLDRVFPAPKKESWKIVPNYDKSFKKVLQNREIKMTNYDIGTVEQTWNVVSVDRFATAVRRRQAEFCENNVPSVARSKLSVLNTTYLDNYDLIRSVDSFPSYEYSDSPSPDLIEETLNRLKADVIRESYSGYDALTELAEFPETLGLLLKLFKAALRPIQGIKALREEYERAISRGKSRKKAHADLMSKWMEYRYGIMPIVYSIQDTIKLLDEAFAEFKTDRSFAVLTSKPIGLHKKREDTHVAIYRGHEVKITVVAKTRYATFSARLKDLISTNIFVTAWELIPFSFVIDWFINVGDVIASATMGFSDLSEERKFCYSIRRTTIDRHVLNYKLSNGIDFYDPRPANPCGNAEIGDVVQYNNLSDSIGSGLLYERKEDSYKRVVFHPETVDLQFAPHLGWQRMLDGYVLSFNEVSNAMKKRR